MITSRRVLVTTLSIAGLMPALASTPPFAVLRSTDAANLAASPAIAVVTAAPFDDVPGLLGDGKSYYYLVLDAGGASLALSVHKNDVLDTARLSFDDSDPLSAPVDAATSTVAVAPAAIPADGLTSALVTIVPRDGDGIVLGAGLAVSLDAWALWPGVVAGAVLDRADGSYEARVVGLAPGQGSARVEVEGVTLAEAPEIVYESAGPLSSRELAILRLRALTASGGPFEASGGESPVVARAAGEALDALAALLAADPLLDVDALRHHLRRAVELLSTLDDPAAASLVDELLDVARLVAEYWVERAGSACGPCDGNLSSLVCQAEQALAAGDFARQGADPDPAEAANLYAKAIDKSLDALERCE